MAPKWTHSTSKHGIPRSDAIHTLLHACYRAVLSRQEEDGRIVLFIGPPHTQALGEDEIEVLAHEFPGTGREAVVFHVMSLGPKFRRYREEHPDA